MWSIFLYMHFAKNMYTYTILVTIIFISEQWSTKFMSSSILFYKFEPENLLIQPEWRLLFVLFCWHEKKLRWHLWKKESIVSIVHRQSNSKHIRIFKETLTLKKKLYVKSWSFWRLNHVIQENSKITRIKTL